MAVKLKTVKPSRWRTLALPEGESLDVLVKLPTWGDKLTAHGFNVFGTDDDEPQLMGRLAEHRIKTTITDWRGVQDDAGKDVPFSFASLAGLCEQSTSLFYQLLNVATDAYVGLTEDSAKNLPKPSSDAPEALPETATNDSTEQSAAISSD